MLRTINNTVRILPIHAFIPPTYWVEALSTATFLINWLPRLLHLQRPLDAAAWMTRFLI
jgi:hypothetical protein